MINLLPPAQKEELVQEEKLKLILIFGIVVLAFLISLILILLSIKIVFSAEFDIQEKYFKDREKALEKTEIKEFEEKIKNLNFIFSNLNNFYQEKIDLTQILEKISNLLPAQTYLTSINFNSTSLQISLLGFCSDRETLIKFKENLEREEKFTNVYFSPSSFLEPNNFSVTFSIKK